MLELCVQNPDNKVSAQLSQSQLDFLLKYMENRFGERATIGDKSKLTNLRTEADRLEKLVAEMRAKKAMTTPDTADDDRGSEDESVESVSKHCLTY